MADDRRDYYRKWREANREKLTLDKARWYQEHKAEQDERNRAWIKAHPEERRRHMKKYTNSHSVPHRLTNARTKARVRGHVFAVKRDEVEQAIIEQEGLCAICGGSEQRIQNGAVQQLSIDHCHNTGRFRGLLCEACNKVLGFMDDDTDRLRAAVNYLERVHCGDSPLFDLESQLY